MTFPASLVLISKLLSRRVLALGALLTVVFPLYGQNLVVNGDFAATDANGGPANWTMENPALVSIDAAEFPPSQLRSLRVNTQDEGTSSLGFVVQSLNVAGSGAPLLPDAQYVARVWVKSSAGDLARLQVKRFNGSTELTRTDSTGSTGGWTRVDVSFDTTGTTRVEIQLRYKKNATAAGQTAWFAGVEVRTAADVAGETRLGAISLVPTFESIGVSAGLDGGYAGQTLEISYRPAGQTDWQLAFAPMFGTAEGEFRGSVLLLQPNTTYEVRARLFLNGTALDEKIASTVTWSDDVPIATEITMPATASGPYVIAAQGTPTGWIRYRAASGGSVIDATGSGAAEAVVLDHAAYVIVEGLTIRGGTKNGLRISDSHDIRIRDCEVSAWSEPGTFAFVNQGDLDYAFVDATGAAIYLRGGIRVQGSGSTRVVLERNLIHHPAGTSPSWAFGHPSGPSGIVLDSTGGNHVIRYNDILAADGHYFNDGIESLQNGSVNGGPYRDTDIYGNLIAGANDDGTELDGGQLNVRYWHNWVEGGSATVSTAPNLKGGSYIFRNILVSGDERGGSQAGSIKMGGAPGLTFLLQNTIVASGYGLTSGHYTSAGTVSPIFSRNNLFTGLQPGGGRVRLDAAVSGDLDFDLIPPVGVLPATFEPGPGRESHATFADPEFVSPDQRDFQLAGGSPGIAAGEPLDNLTPAGVDAPDLGAVDSTNAHATWPIRPDSPETAPNLLVVRVRQGQTASADLTLRPDTSPGVAWTARAGDAWLTLSAASGLSGSTSQTITCTVNPAGLAVGPHRSFVSIRTATGGLRTVPVVAEIEPAQTLSFVRETETALPVAGFQGGSDANAANGGYVQAVTLQSGQTAGEIGLDFDIPEAGIYFVMARVRAAGPANLIPTQDSIWLRVDSGEEYRWDLWGIGEDTWSWNRAHVVPATPTENMTGHFVLPAGAHRIVIRARELGAQVDQIMVTNDPFVPASAPGPVPVIFTGQVPDAGTGAAFQYTLVAGGEGPLTWTLVGGDLPSGLTLASNGLLSGTPAAAGSSTFTVQVRDANGDTVTRTYTLNVTLPPVAAPTFSPSGGTYTSIQSVSLASATPGAAIRYTLDGSVPTGTNGNVYAGPIELSASAVLRAVATKAGMADSAVTSATYTINLPQAAAPVFSPEPGTYSGAQFIAMTTATPDAAIRYTTDGSVPSATHGTLYDAAVPVTTTTTLKAVAVAGGALDSAVTSGTYAIGAAGAFQFGDGQLVMEAEHFTSAADGAGQRWTAVTFAGASGAENNALQGLENLGVGYPTLSSTLPRVDYAFDQAPAGNYYVFIRTFGASSTDDSVYVSLDGATAVSQVVTAARTLDWKRSPATLTIPAGRHTLTIWMREDGVVIDKIVVKASTTLPTDVGPAESLQAPAFLLSPISQSATVGDTVTFRAEAAGNPAPQYQWQKDGADLPGASGATLVLPDITLAQAGSYRVVASNGVGSVTSELAQLTVNPAHAGVTLGDLTRAYDGTPKEASAITAPAGLNVVVTYAGSVTPPVAPGSYPVTATLNDPDYVGSVDGTLVIATTALVRHAPGVNGILEGSLQLGLPESFALNSQARVSGDILVPGQPAVTLNGAPVYAGTTDGSGSATPAGYQVTLNAGATLRHVVRRTDALALVAVAAPPAPLGTRSVVLNAPGQSPGDYTTLANLTLNGSAGTVVVPAGTYGAFAGNPGTHFVFGVAGATEPAVYNLQSLTLNSGAEIELAGPVLLTMANGLSVGGGIGNSAHPQWLTLQIATGGVTLNSGARLDGVVLAPAGTVTINGNARLNGRVESDRLVINSGGVLHQMEF